MEEEEEEGFVGWCHYHEWVFHSLEVNVHRFKRLYYNTNTIRKE
jgi:hypothetical protein